MVRLNYDKMDSKDVMRIKTIPVGHRTCSDPALGAFLLLLRVEVRQEEGHECRPRFEFGGFRH